MVVPRPLPLPTVLRAWRKEERRTPPNRRLILRAAGISLVALAPLLALHMHHRTSHLRQVQNNSLSDTLAIMAATLSSTDRAARDWGHWNDAYLFATGRKPDHPDTLAGSALFDGGAVMVILGDNGRHLLVHADPPLEPAAQTALIRCTRHNRSWLPRTTSTVKLACEGGNGSLYLGAATSISNNGATAPAAGTLAIFEPLLQREYSSGIRQRLEDLRRHLIFLPRIRSTPLPDDKQLIEPQIHSANDTLLALRRPPLTPMLLQSLLGDLSLLLSVPLLLAILRALPMLERRRQRITQRRVEREANRRIRRTCRALDDLLEGMQADAPPPEDARILHRLSRAATAAPPAAAPSQLERISERFQHFLRSASSLALFDALTQLPNRSYFIERLREETEQQGAAGRSFAVLFVDVDKFKVINDTYGHAVGDAVLLEVTRRLRQGCGREDFIGRYGGDEFAVILAPPALPPEQAPPEQVGQLARRQARALVETLAEPLPLPGPPISVSLSIGITVVEAGDRDVAAVMQRADLAMYQAKRCRSSRIAGPGDLPEVHALGQYQLFSDLMEAVRRRQLQVFFQSISDSCGRRLGVEALARWQHPERGWIAPSLFLELAEQHRQMHSLGGELIRLSLDGFQQLQRREPGLRLFLNLAPSQLLEEGLAERLLLQLAERSLSPRLVTLELTEHAMLEPHPLVHRNLEQLRLAGARLALDDFGSGHSSLSLLRSLRPEVLKIDKSFIQASRREDDALEIIRLIAQLAPPLGLEVIAEGIEDTAVLTQLHGLGIGAFQGYALERPAPLEQWLLGRQAQADNAQLACGEGLT